MSEFQKMPASSRSADGNSEVVYMHVCVCFFPRLHRNSQIQTSGQCDAALPGCVCKNSVLVTLFLYVELKKSVEGGGIK